MSFVDSRQRCAFDAARDRYLQALDGDLVHGYGKDAVPFLARYCDSTAPGVAQAARNGLAKIKHPSARSACKPLKQARPKKAAPLARLLTEALAHQPASRATSGAAHGAQTALH